MHRELVLIARELAAREPGRPRRASLARAVSTAYYALFHALAAFCARELVGARGASFRHVYRSLDHAHSRKVLNAARGSAEFGAEAGRIAENFLLLQRLRHEADYDPGYRISRGATQDLIDRAAEVPDLLARLDAVQRKLLAARLVARTRAT